MKQFWILILLFSIACTNNDAQKLIFSKKEISDFYKSVGLNGKISYDAFKKAYTGYKNLPFSSHIITVIDFSLSSSKKRFAVIDLEQKKLLYHTHSSHGQNTGDLYAKHFSNKNGSHQSSLGFYKTGATYNGKHGYSLRLHGLESGFNDQAYKRAIVVHSAKYLTESYIQKNKRAGRSWGCPALPPKLSKEIINVIKNGTYLFIYAKDKDYLSKSEYLKVEKDAN